MWWDEEEDEEEEEREDRLVAFGERLTQTLTLLYGMSTL